MNETPTTDHLGRPYITNSRLVDMVSELRRTGLTTEQARQLYVSVLMSHGKTGDFLVDVVGVGKGDRQSVAGRRNYDVIQDRLMTNLISMEEEAKGD